MVCSKQMYEAGLISCQRSELANEKQVTCLSAGASCRLSTVSFALRISPAFFPLLALLFPLTTARLL